MNSYSRGGNATPASFEAEEAVIGRLMLDNSKLGEVCALITTDHFFYETNRVIFEAITKLTNEQKAIDALLLSQELERTNKLTNVGDIYAYLCKIELNTPSASNVVEYAQVIKQKSLDRKTMSCAEQLKQNPENIESIIAELKQIEALKGGIGGSIIYRQFSTIEPKPIKWLWKNRIAKGKVVIIAGNPSLGKSQLTANIAAIATTGRLFPMDRMPCNRCKAIFLSAEDDAADTIRPRLEAAEADLEQAFIIDAVIDNHNNGHRCFNLKTDLDRLSQVLEEKKDVGLIIIDPITAYLGSTDSHKNAEVRALLAPLGELAAKYGVAIVCISHLSKGGSNDALMRVMGSLAFVAAARAAFIVTQDPADKTKRLFLPTKNNISNEETGLAFKIESIQLKNGIDTSKIVWLDEPVTTTANEVMFSSQNMGEHGALEDAMEFLSDLLADKSMLQREIMTQAKVEGYAPATIRRAKDELKIESIKDGMKGGWIWTLPPKVLKFPEDAQEKNVSTFDKNEHLRQNQAISKVMCKDCLHFERDKIGDGSGIGSCGIKCDEHKLHGGIAIYPTVQRVCKGYSKNKNESGESIEEKI